MIHVRQCVGGLSEIMLHIRGGKLVVMMVMMMGGVLMVVMRMVVIMMMVIVALMAIITVTIKDAHCEMQKVSSVPLRGRVRSG